MINTGRALKLFEEEFKRIYGENEKIEPGDEFAVILNNCVMFIAVDNEKNIKIRFTPDVIKINESLDIYAEEDIEPQNDQLQKSLTKLKLVAKSRTHNLRETEVYKMAVNDCINVIEQIRMVNKSE